MMAEFRWIKMSLFLMLLLQFTAAKQLFQSLSVRVGDDVTLSCENVIDDQNNCDITTWIYSESGNTAVELVTDGKIVEKAMSKSDRLSVTENCSLVIKKVTDEDAGHYDCRQFKSGQRQCQDAVVHLSVVDMTEQKHNDDVTLNCSVRTYERCRHTVKWLLQGQDVNKDNKDIKTSQSLCSASVTFLTSHYIYTSRYKLFTCAVTDGDKVQVFPFRSQSSGEKPGEDTITTTTESTTVLTTTASATNAASTKQQGLLLRFIIVSVGLAVLIIIVVAVNIWSRTKEKKTQMDEITVRYDEGDGTVNYENIRASNGV